MKFVGLGLGLVNKIFLIQTQLYCGSKRWFLSSNKESPQESQKDLYFPSTLSKLVAGRLSTVGDIEKPCSGSWGRMWAPLQALPFLSPLGSLPNSVFPKIGHRREPPAGGFTTVICPCVWSRTQCPSHCLSFHLVWRSDLVPSAWMHCS